MVTQLPDIVDSVDKTRNTAGTTRHSTKLPAVRISRYTASCATGLGLQALSQALQAQRCALRPNDFTTQPLQTWVGRVPNLEAHTLPEALQDWHSRNNLLAWVALQQDDFAASVQTARSQWGAHRIGVIVGTSTSNIGETESVYAQLAQAGSQTFAPAQRRAWIHSPHGPAHFVQQALALKGPCMTLSTACSSSAKALATAQRWLHLNWADAVVVGGVDSLCASTLFGFHALNLVSATPCRPFDAHRSGISIGEAAGFALLHRGDSPAPDALTASSPATPLWLLGCGESSDAHHMSSPHPEGRGARQAVMQALAHSGLHATAIDYLNLHGTASAKNDDVEAHVLADLYPPTVHASATKGITGHTMGAAGILEAVICALALTRGELPGTANTTQWAHSVPACLQRQPARRHIRYAMSHSFGFGGNNVALVLAHSCAADSAPCPSHDTPL